jgi:hypothetical protein
MIVGNGYATSLGALSLPASVLGGDLVAQRSASVGFLQFGGATNSGTLDFNSGNANAFTFFRQTGGTFAAVFGGLYTNSSDAQFKENVAPITQALQTLAQLKPSAYNWIADNQADLGFIAQETSLR